MITNKKKTNNNICTVLLLSYNHAPYISKCIESVLSQKTQYPFIIKIFDDASTDGTQDIIREYAKKYPNLIEAHISETNQGAQMNIWKAYKSVDTKYYILTETDDYWCDNLRLEMQINALEKHPDCSFCSTNTLIKVIEDKYLPFFNNRKQISNNIFKKKIINFDYINKKKAGFFTHLSSRVVRSSCMELDKIKNKESYAFDAAQFFYLLTKGNMYWIDKISSVYVKTGKGISTSASAEKRINMFVRAMTDLNEDTDYKIWGKIAQQIHLNRCYWTTLESRKRFGIPLNGKRNIFQHAKRLYCVLRTCFSD